MEKYDAENAKLDVVEVLPLWILLVDIYLLLIAGMVHAWRDMAVLG